MTESSGATWRYRHDSLGRLIEAADPRGNVTRGAYDLIGRLVRVEAPDGNVRELAYDPEGNVVRARDGLHDISMTHRGLGLLASRTEAGTTVRLQYDSEGQLVAVVNGYGDVHAVVRDPAGEVRSERWFDETEVTCERDPAGRVTTVYRPGVGKTTRYEYDSAGRATKIEHSDGPTVTLEHREDGALMRADNGDVAVELERDALGRVTRETTTVDGESHWISTQYDYAGRPIARASSHGVEQTFARDARGDWSGVTVRRGTETWEIALTRDLMGREVDRKLPGGARSYVWRDELGRPTQHFVGRGETPHRFRRFAWEPGNRWSGGPSTGAGRRSCIATRGGS